MENGREKLAFLSEISDTIVLKINFLKALKSRMLKPSVLCWVLAKRWTCVFACVVCIFFALVVAWPHTIHAKETANWLVNEIAYADLPKQGRAVYDQIHRGEPFSHSKDGSIFFNRERLLPKHTRGYYREYTVRTPGVKHRGARRIVCGGLQVSQPDVCYYTADHYASFRKIVP
jgi:ribonuclease T1